MRTLSASQLKLYRQCRQQYHDKYITPRENVIRIEDTSGLLGTGIHKAIELYYKAGKSPTGVFTSTVRDTLAEWQDNGIEVNYYYSYADVVEQGLDILAGFDFTQFNPVENEVAFNLPFYDICKVRGFMDLITDDDTIVDFKSAKRKPKDLQSDPQFMLYAWSFFQMYGRWPKKVLWYHLRTHETFEFNFDWNKFDAIAVQTAREIVSDDFSDLTGERCSKCSPWCPRYKTAV
jgi:hypothetical protein